MSFRSLHGPVSGSQHWSTIGSDGWLLSNIVLQSLFLVGTSTDKAAVERLRPQMNFLTRLSLGLEIQIHGSERRGRRAKDSRSSWRIIDLCWGWMVWGRFRTRLVHKKGAYVSPPSRRLCASLLPSIQGFA